jgi:hypothetical protein
MMRNLLLGASCMSKRSFFTSVFAVLAMLASAYASGSMITLADVNNAQVRNSVYSGLYTLNIDGQNVLGMCDDFNTETYVGAVWSASSYGYADIVGGAPVKFAAGGTARYSQIGYLFSLVPTVTTTQQADINLAIWKIMTPTAALTLSGNALAYYNTATGGAYNAFDYSSFMRVWTPTPINASQEFLTVPLVPPASVPLPATAWLFMSGLVGLVGVARRAHP